MEMDVQVRRRAEALDHRHRAGLNPRAGLAPYVRISYATADEVLRDACTRIQRACAALR
jgi:hypothetical protein